MSDPIQLTVVLQPNELTVSPGASTLTVQAAVSDTNSTVYNAGGANVGLALDGVTDDTAKLNAFLAGLTGPTHLVFPAGKTAKINGAVAYNSAFDLTISGEPGATIDGSASVAQFLISLGGGGDATGDPLANPTPTSAALAASVSKGAISITSTLTGVTAGSVLLVSMRAYCVANDPGTYAGRAADGAWFDPALATSYQGEMVEVDSVTPGMPNTFALKSPLFAGYTAAKTAVYLLSQMPRISVQNLTILRNGNTNTFGLWINRARAVEVSGCKISGARERPYYLSYCYGGTFSNNTATDFYYSGSGNSDNMFATVQNLLITDNRIVGGRQAIDLGGWEPCRQVEIVNNFLDNYKALAVPVGCLSTHGNCEKILIANNFCGDGITIQAINSVVRGNIIVISGQQWGVQCLPDTGCDYLEISGNYIYQLGTGAMTKAVTFSTLQGGTSLTPLNLTFGDIVISENTANDGLIQNGVWFGPTINYCYLTVRNLKLSSNRFRTISSPLFVGRAGGTTGTRNYLRNVVVDGGDYYGLQARAVNYFATFDAFEVVRFVNAYLRTDADKNSGFSDYPISVTANGDFYLQNCVVAGNEDGSLNTPAPQIFAANAFVARSTLRYSDLWAFTNAAGLVWLEENRYVNTSGSITTAGTMARHVDRYGHNILGSAAVPAIAAGTGAGTTPTVSVSGSDQAGTITITTGTTPAASATVATVTFGNAYPAIPRSVILTPAEPNAAFLSGSGNVYEDVASRAAGSFALKVGSAALTAATTYKWNYQIVG